jgi:hypothetical protein
MFALGLGQGEDAQALAIALGISPEVGAPTVISTSEDTGTGAGGMNVMENAARINWDRTQACRAASKSIMMSCESMAIDRSRLLNASALMISSSDVIQMSGGVDANIWCELTGEILVESGLVLGSMDSMEVVAARERVRKVAEAEGLVEINAPVGLLRSEAITFVEAERRGFVRKVNRQVAKRALTRRGGEAAGLPGIEFLGKYGVVRM